MKKILLLVSAFFVFSLSCLAQDILPQGKDFRLYDFYSPARFRSPLLLPPPIDFATSFPSTTLEGAFAYDSTVKSVKFHNGTAWQTVGNQFTPTQATQLLALIYQNNSSTLTVSPTSGERGVAASVNVTYNIIPGDDVFTSASINNGIGAVTWGDGSHTVSGGSRTNTITWTLTKNFTRNGSAQSQTQTATYTTYIPQWSGNSTATDYTSYASISADLTKTIQATATITRAFTAGSKAWFIVTSGTGTITGNGFTYTIGNEGDNTVFFWRKAYTLTLADGTTTAPVYLIHSREDLAAPITFIHQ